MFEDDPIVTPAFRERTQDVMFGRVTRGAGGVQEVSYTFKLEPGGDFSRGTDCSRRLLGALFSRSAPQ